MSAYRIVRRAYPTNYWSDHGSEIIETANELNGDSWSFRESRELLSNGLRTRGLEATDRDIRQVWIQGLTIFVFTVLIQMVSALLASELGLLPNLQLTYPRWGTPLVALALVAMTISTRWPVMLAVAAVVGAPGLTNTWAVPHGLLLIGLFLATAIAATQGTGRRVLSPWILLAAITVSLGTIKFFFFGPGLAVPVLLILGLATVRLDARLAAVASIHAFFYSATVFSTVGTSDFTGSTVPFGLIIGTVWLLVAVGIGLLTNRSTRRAMT